MNFVLTVDEYDGCHIGQGVVISVCWCVIGVWCFSYFDWIYCILHKAR